MHIDDWEEAPGKGPRRLLSDKSELPREVPSGIVEAPREIFRRSQEVFFGS